MGITGEHAGIEVRKLDDLATAKENDSVEVSVLRGIVKGVAVVVKLLVGIRGNQVAIMKKMGIELRTPRDRRPATDERPANAKE